jgi:hypothetical protein
MSIKTDNTDLPLRPKGELIKESDEKKQSYKKKSAFYRLCYTEDGEFSITRITMALTFITALGIVPVGILLHAIWKIEIPKDIYSHIAVITGGSILQYGGTKIKATLKQRNANA